jgi:hypothetical protein
MSDGRTGDPTTPGTHGYPSGTDGYPLSSDGRPVDPEEARAPEEPSSGPAGPPDDESEGGGDDAAYWRRYGFSSFQEFLEEFEAVQRRANPEWREYRDVRDLPASELPGDEIAEVAPRRRRTPVRQVGVKLRAADYEALANAAFLYGVRPTTMARLLVNRGVRAVLESRDELNG